MIRILVVLLVVSMLVLPVVTEGTTTKGITFIMPWRAGGSSGLIGRLLTADTEQTMH